MKNSVLDDLRIIFNFDMDSKDYAILILAGQLPFITQLNRQTHEALRQRIVMNYCLKGLTREETKSYILSRLELAGCHEPIFTDCAFELLFSSTNGCIAGAGTKLEESWLGSIAYLNQFGSHYEMLIHSRSSIYVLFGKAKHGYFACIPDWQAGCHLVDFNDLFWNTESLSRVLGEIDGITVAKALYSIADLVKNS